MDVGRVEAYLRLASSVINMDVTELWSASKVGYGNDDVSLRFLKLYKNPGYDDSHQILITPESGDEESKHCFSPILCRSVCNCGQIVWANANMMKGLTGKIDLPLNTAIALPLCSIDQDLIIMVLYSTEKVALSANVVEFLTALQNILCMPSTSFLPMNNATSASLANTEHVFGLWDLNALIKKHYRDISFHLLPMPRTQFYGHLEKSCLEELVVNFKYTKDVMSTAGQLTMLHTVDSDTSGTKPIDDDIESTLSDITSTGTGITTVTSVSDKVSGSTNSASSTASSSNGNGTTKAPSSTIIPPTTDTSSGAGAVARSRIKSGPSTACESTIEVGGNPGGTIFDMNDQIFASTEQSDGGEGRSTHLMDALSSYQDNRMRFHEFALAVIGMSIFDSAEIWLTDSSSQDLCAVAALRCENESMSPWLECCRDVRLKVGQDVPGTVVSTNQPYWDFKYGEHVSATHPRAEVARNCGIMTAFAVPLPGVSGPIGAFAFYSTIAIPPEAMMSTLIAKASLQLCSASVDKLIVNTFDVESIVHTPRITLLNWVQSVQKPAEIAEPSVFIPKTLPPPVVHLQFMEDAAPANLRLVPNPFEGKGTIATTTNPSSKYGTRQSTGTGSGSSFAALAPMQRKNTPRIATPAGMVSTGAEKQARICRNETCNNICLKRSPYCASHTGTRHCHYEGCTKCAQGSTKFCIAHGGGRRCTYPGCDKGARDKFFCAAHGGGKRCTHSGCTKSAVGGSKLCTAHGGGKRCQHPGCDKASQSSTHFCVRHGGGRKCRAAGCSKVARGRTEFCAVHNHLNSLLDTYMPPPSGAETAAQTGMKRSADVVPQWGDESLPDLGKRSKI